MEDQIKQALNRLLTALGTEKAAYVTVARIDLWMVLGALTPHEAFKEGLEEAKKEEGAPCTHPVEKIRQKLCEQNTTVSYCECGVRVMCPKCKMFSCNCVKQPKRRKRKA